MINKVAAAAAAARFGHQHRRWLSSPFASIILCHKQTLLVSPLFLFRRTPSSLVRQFTMSASSSSCIVACQRNSYTRTLETQVKWCTENVDKKKGGFLVELADTILFPEGGGQPSDFGEVNFGCSPLFVRIILSVLL